MVDGSRVGKADARLNAIGDVDEANSAIGVAIVALGDGEPVAVLRRMQNDLFDLGADLATPGEDFTPNPMALRIVAAQVAWLEARIDAITAMQPPLTSFILPGGSAGAAALHVARAVVRRAERSMVQASETVPLNPLALAYINRLSDYLFVAARQANAGGAGDILWRPGASR